MTHAVSYGATEGARERSTGQDEGNPYTTFFRLVL